MKIFLRNLPFDNIKFNYALLQDYIKIHNVHKESGRTVLETGGSVANRVNKNASLYLTGVLEYITDELNDLSASSAMSDRRRRINARDLQVVFENDEELKMLKAKMGIDILGGGVIPKIHTRLIPKKK
jgi:histone H3/H4